MDEELAYDESLSETPDVDLTPSSLSLKADEPNAATIASNDNELRAIESQHSCSSPNFHSPSSGSLLAGSSRKDAQVQTDVELPDSPKDDTSSVHVDIDESHAELSSSIEIGQSQVFEQPSTEMKDTTQTLTASAECQAIVDSVLENTLETCFELDGEVPACVDNSSEEFPLQGDKMDPSDELSNGLSFAEELALFVEESNAELGYLPSLLSEASPTGMPSLSGITSLKLPQEPSGIFSMVPEAPPVEVQDAINSTKLPLPSSVAGEPEISEPEISEPACSLPDTSTNPADQVHLSPEVGQNESKTASPLPISLPFTRDVFKWSDEPCDVPVRKLDSREKKFIKLPSRATASRPSESDFKKSDFFANAFSTADNSRANVDKNTSDIDPSSASRLVTRGSCISEKHVPRPPLSPIWEERGSLSSMWATKTGEKTQDSLSLDEFTAILENETAKLFKGKPAKDDKKSFTFSPSVAPTKDSTPAKNLTPTSSDTAENSNSKSSVAESKPTKSPSPVPKGSSLNDSRWAHADDDADPDKDLQKGVLSHFGTSKNVPIAAANKMRKNKKKKGGRK